MNQDQDEQNPIIDSGERLQQALSRFAYTPLSPRVKRPREVESNHRPFKKPKPELKELNDYLELGLDVIFCGINPGEQSAISGHHYANPTNHFWSCLHEAGFTSTKLHPREDSTLPGRFNIGLTNLVRRPTVEAAELSKSELRDGVPSFLQRIAKYKPKVVCFVGIGIADAVCEYLHVTKRSGPGRLSCNIVHDDSQETLLYAVSSTSGRVVRYQKSDKIRQFRDVKALLALIPTGEEGHMTSIRSSTFAQDACS